MCQEARSLGGGPTCSSAPSFRDACLGFREAQGLNFCDVFFFLGSQGSGFGTPVFRTLGVGIRVRGLACRNSGEVPCLRSDASQQETQE